MLHNQYTPTQKLLSLDGTRLITRGRNKINSPLSGVKLEINGLQVIEMVRRYCKDALVTLQECVGVPYSTLHPLPSSTSLPPASFPLNIPFHPNPPTPPPPYPPSAHLLVFVGGAVSVTPHTRTSLHRVNRSEYRVEGTWLESHVSSGRDTGGGKKEWKNKGHFRQKVTCETVAWDERTWHELKIEGEIENVTCGKRHDPRDRRDLGRQTEITEPDIWQEQMTQVSDMTLQCRDNRWSHTRKKCKATNTTISEIYLNTQKKIFKCPNDKSPTCGINFRATSKI